MTTNQDTLYSITGIGVIGRFGTGTEDLSNKIQLFTSGSLPDYSSKSDQSTDFPPVNTDCLKQFLPPHKLRRTDHFSQLAIAAVFLALDSCGLKPKECQNSGVVVATGYGPVASTCMFKESYFNNGPPGASPLMFTKSVQNQAAAHLSMLLDIKGPLLTVCQHTLPFQHALLHACTLLETKKVQRVIVGGVDEYTIFLDYCRQRYEDKKITGKTRLTTFTGEGAAFFILEKAAIGAYETAISCPTFTRIPPCEKIAIPSGTVCSNGCHELQKITSDQHNSPAELIDFSSLSGGFPASAALDLAAATMLPRINQRLLMERAPTGLVARMMLTQKTTRG